MSALGVGLMCAPLVGCAASHAASPPAAPAGDFDRPVPADEPRATVALSVDLEASRDCEERFDLAIYRDRGVELVAWDDREGRCSGREVSIRYLTAMLNEMRLLALVKEHAKNVKKIKR